MPEVEHHLAEVRAMKILVAEDDAISRMLLQRTLQRAGL